MIFYFKAQLYDLDNGYTEEMGITIAPNFADATKQIEKNMFDSLVSIESLEPIDGTDILYLTNNPLRKQIIESIKEGAMW